MREKSDDPGLLLQFQIQRVSKVRRSNSPEALTRGQSPLPENWGCNTGSGGVSEGALLVGI